jgi:hypothetical protein
VAVDALEVRMAGLEGAYEQINARLGGVEHRLESLGQRMTSEFAAVRSEMREGTAGLRGDNAELRKEMREADAELRKRVDLILIGVFFAILLQIAIRVFFP